MLFSAAQLCSLSLTIEILTCYYLVLRIERKRRIKRRRRRSSYFFKSRKDISCHLRSYSEKSFRLASRMSKNTFMELLDILRPYLTKDSDMGRVGSAGAICPGIRLFVTLRLLAGASPRDLSVLCRIGLSTVYSIFHETIDVIISTFPLPGISSELEVLKQKALEFSLSRTAVLGVSCNPFHGCVAAIDGLTIDIIMPDVANTADYINRYSSFAFPVTATVGPRYEFLTASAVATGSTHDSTAFQMSNIGHFVQEGGLPPGFWIAGDDAYGLSESIITPFPTSDLDAWKSSLNYFLSSLRVHIEQAFGMLRMKFCILQRPLRFRLRRSVRVVCAAMALHNLCIAKEEWFHEKDLERIPRHTVQDAGDELQLWLDESNLESELDLRNDNAIRSRTRDRMLDVIKSKGLLRPNDF